MALPVMGAAPTNTYLEPTDPDVREDLLGVMQMVDPQEVPFFSMINHGSASQTLTEWLVQEKNPAANVPQPEGFTALISPPKVPQRLNNIQQIGARTVGVSNTLRVVDQVGGDEYSRQMVLRGLELRRDVELAITGNSVKTIADPRQMSGFQTWVVATDFGAGGSAPTGDGTNAPTVGTPRNLTLPLVLNAMQTAWNQGGEPNAAIMSASLKRAFTLLAATEPASSNGIVANQILQSTQPHPITIVGSTAVYLTDFGTLDLVPDRYMPAHVILMPDTNYVEMAFLPNRSFNEVDLATTGDNTQGMVVVESTLRVLAPKAHAQVVGLIE